MSDDSSDPIPPELQTWVDAEIHFESRPSAAAQQELHVELAAQPGIAELSVTGGLIAIRYDPEQTTIARLREIVVIAGLKITAIENAAIAPPIAPEPE